MSAEYTIPNAASVLKVDVDLKAQTIRVAMHVDAPGDRQKALPRVNWLLRQLRDVDGDNVYVRLLWPSRAQGLVCTLDGLRTDAKAALQGTDLVPRAFEVFLIRDDSRRFAGRRTFIEDIEAAVPTFYDQIGQRLEQWRAKPPRPVKEEPKDETADEKPESSLGATTKPAPMPEPMPGNQHGSLLDIPQFLVRFRQS